MSRTKHHRTQKSQHCGEDFWSRRAGMGYYAYTTYNKRLTISRERAVNHANLHKIVLSNND